MSRKIKKAAAAVLAAVAMTAAVPAGSAWAIGQVPCNNDEFARITAHGAGWSDYDLCFANAGSIRVFHPNGSLVWVTKIWSGNNRVQWFGDDRWQPASPIGKWTTFTWPNHPGGVRLDEFRIL